jgi:hypothetical protein
MISYSWKDGEAAELLHDELAMRGFQVLHDRYSFGTGERIAAAMTSGVERCDVFIPYLTRNSLYIDHEADAPRPALIGELMPALRRRRVNLTPGRPDQPIIIPISHGLGDRNDASAALKQVTGEDLGSLWGPTLDQDTSHITQAEAADIAARALPMVVTRDRFKDIVTLAVATRGTTPPAKLLTLDATRILGGERRPGNPAEWERFRRAVTSIAECLVAHTRGSIRLELACHLSAAFGVGRTFHQASGWSPIIETRHGDSTPATRSDGGHLLGAFDQYGEHGDLIVDIDLLGHNVAAQTDRLAATLPDVAGRLSLSPGATDDLTPQEIAATARSTAERVRHATGTIRPMRIHLTMAAPAAYAALLGHHMTALTGDVITYEHHDDRYHQALTLEATTP